MAPPIADAARPPVWAAVCVRAADRIDAALAAATRLSLWLALLIALGQTAVVLARDVLALSAIAAQEAVVWAYGLLILTAAVDGVVRDAHVRVDIARGWFSPRRKALIDLLGALLGVIPLAGLILWSAAPMTALSWRIAERSAEPGGLAHVFVLKGALCVFAVGLGLAGAAKALRAVPATLRPLG